MAPSRVAVVTGANKGIGYHIVKLLLRSKTQNFVYLTSRDETRGKAAIEAIEKEETDSNYSEKMFGS